jgi:hypothetical protein
LGDDNLEVAKLFSCDGSEGTIWQLQDHFLVMVTKGPFGDHQIIF